MRVLMARLRREDWFESSRVGRQSRYTLTEEGWRLLDTFDDAVTVSGQGGL